ncbi:MAG: calcium-binding protein [Oscillospiraceae bacterium]|nr:calcium-binding protein [Oscillospiraceae bacterium]
MHVIEFKDEFDEDTGICSICGADTNLTGWNEEKGLSRFECESCGAIFIYDEDYNKTIVKGEKRNWEKFMTENMTFPFNGVIAEAQGNIFSEEKGPINYGDKVIVKKVVGEDDLYGVIVEIKLGKKSYDFPLCDIAALDEKSANYKILDNYRVWFANCQ